MGDRSDWEQGIGNSTQSWEEAVLGRQIWVAGTGVARDVQPNMEGRHQGEACLASRSCSAQRDGVPSDRQSVDHGAPKSQKGKRLHISGPTLNCGLETSFWFLCVGRGHGRKDCWGGRVLEDENWSHTDLRWYSSLLRGVPLTTLLSKAPTSLAR